MMSLALTIVKKKTRKGSQLIIAIELTQFICIFVRKVLLKNHG
jgi:hypothetical protein